LLKLFVIDEYPVRILASCASLNAGPGSRLVSRPQAIHRLLSILSAGTFTRTGRDPMARFITSHLKSPLARYVIGVVSVWALIFVVGYFHHGSTPGHPLLKVFLGFLLGMLSMYIATRIHRTRQDGANT
jgi:hypothetical protein